MNKITTRDDLLALIARETKARAVAAGRAERSKDDKDAPVIFRALHLPHPHNVGWITPFTSRQAVKIVYDCIDHWKTHFRYEYAMAAIAASCFMGEPGRPSVQRGEELPEIPDGLLEPWFDGGNVEQFVKAVDEWSDCTSGPRAMDLYQYVRLGLGYPDWSNLPPDGTADEEEPAPETMASLKARRGERAAGTWVRGIFAVDPSAALFVTGMTESVVSRAHDAATVNFAKPQTNFAKKSAVIAGMCLRTGPGGDLLCEKTDDVLDMQFGAVTALSLVTADLDLPERGDASVEGSFCSGGDRGGAGPLRDKRGARRR